MSTPLLQKSTENLDSARLLIYNKCCNSSIHCSYYACLQLIKQILYNEIGISQLDAILDTRTTDTHRYLIQEIAQRYSTKTGQRYKTIRDTLNKVKRSRKEADYEIKKFDVQESNDILKDAEYVISLLESTF